MVDFQGQVERHVAEQKERNPQELKLDKSHVKQLAKLEHERKRLLAVATSADDRKKLAAEIERHKKEDPTDTSEHKLTDAEHPVLEKYAEELKKEPEGTTPATDKPKSTWENIVGGIGSGLGSAGEYLSKLKADYVDPVIDQIKDLMGGGVGTLFKAMGWEIPSWAKPGAMELRPLKNLLKNDPKVKGTVLTESDSEDNDRKAMRELKTMFLKIDKTKPGAPKNIQEFLREVVLKAKEIKNEPSDPTVNMQDIVDAVGQRYPETKAVQPPAAPTPAPQPAPAPTPSTPPAPEAPTGAPEEYKVAAADVAATLPFDDAQRKLTAADLVGNNPTILGAAIRLIGEKEQLFTKTPQELKERSATLGRVIESKKSSNGNDLNEETVKALKWLKYLIDEKVKSA